MTGCWKGSRPCFMLSVLVYLALPIPCDALGYGIVDICVPPQVGDSWTYHRTTGIQTSSTTYETRIDTVIVSVVGTEQVGDQEYYRVHVTNSRWGDGELYRASADGVIWWYDAKSAEEYIYFDLWRVGIDQKGEIRYEGVFGGLIISEESELVRWGPLEMVVDHSLYSGIFKFWFTSPIEIQECETTLYIHPQIGLIRSYTVDLEARQETLELISFNLQSSESNVSSAVREVTWGTVKKRHMSERPR